MPIIGSEGAASSQGFGQFARTAVANYIEDVFQTWLYTGNGATQTITNGIDLSGKGGLVWVFRRSGGNNHILADTARGVNNYISTNSTAAQQTSSTFINAFNSNGFSGGVNVNSSSGDPFVSWTFREQPKFFDVVTYTGNGANRTIAHNLQSVPGCIIVKRTDSTGDWRVYHIAEQPNKYFSLNLTSGDLADTTMWNNTAPTSSVFSLGTNTSVNASGGTYVAYLFAHNAGGFGLSGTDNVISCGSYVGNGSTTGPVVTLGYEPQWLLIKQTSASGTDWNLIDNMRGFVVGGTDAELNPNLSNAESTGTFVSPTSTGFQLNTTDSGYNGSGVGYLYIAIRRGPMKVPTTGTSVFFPKAISSDASGILVDSGWPVDFYGTSTLTSTGGPWVLSRLTGNTQLLRTPLTNAEATFSSSFFSLDRNNGLFQNNWQGAQTQVGWAFRRAPGFFDEVCYTGNGVSGTTQAHNLGVQPELLIIKARTTATFSTPWITQATNAPAGKVGFLNTTDAFSGGISFTVTSSTFALGNASNNNEAGVTYVAYLFASAPGVSKVGSYTGTGATQVINCGFTAGSRFVLIKSTSASGDWYVWDSARGIVASNDPYLVLNSTAAEVTGTDWVDTAATGFELSNAAGNLANSNGVSYIFLAIS